MPNAFDTVLLPLREKVSAQPTDEGSRRVLKWSPDRANRTGLRDPSSDPFGATFSRKGRRVLR
jgi:hypothetical protein